MRILENILEFSIIITTLAYLYIAPYTKVEESFNIQATHDMLLHGLKINKVNSYIEVLNDYSGIIMNFLVLFHVLLLVQ